MGNQKGLPSGRLPGPRRGSGRPGGAGMGQRGPPAVGRAPAAGGLGTGPGHAGDLEWLQERRLRP